MTGQDDDIFTSPISRHLLDLRVQSATRLAQLKQDHKIWLDESVAQFTAQIRKNAAVRALI